MYKMHERVYMATRQKRNSGISLFLSPIIIGGIICYFAYHAFHGDYGLVAHYRMEKKVEQLLQERDVVIAERETLSRKVAAMRLDTLDADMLDERARINLNVVRRDEIIILRSPAHIN